MMGMLGFRSDRWRWWLSTGLAVTLLGLLGSPGLAQTQSPAVAPRVRIPQSRPGSAPPPIEHPRPEPSPPLDAPASSLSMQDRAANSTYVVLGYNDLGMHCLNQDFSEICILPPFNTLRAQVLRRGREPEIVTNGFAVEYSIPGNTTSAAKTNFWTHAPKLFGKPIARDVGLTGNRMTGKLTARKDFLEVSGIPLTPLTDNGVNHPFQLSRLVVRAPTGKILAETRAVVPASWELNCHLCHNTPGVSVATNILRAHDRRFKTGLEKLKPVLCASCHADAALGATGKRGVSSFSHAMHRSHAPRMSQLPKLRNACYACHPGIQNECQRDVHATRGLGCVDCHGDMQTVAQVTRRPWVDEPRCVTCHQSRKPDFDFEEPGQLFKDSRGHGDVACAACHGPQHATGPATTVADNAQAILWQGQSGVIRKCTVCHTEQPSQPFFHSRDEPDSADDNHGADDDD